MQREMISSQPAAEAATRRAALVATTLTSFLTPFMDSGANVALPEISRQFGMDAVVLSWVRMAYLLAAAIFLVPFGKLADIYGRKRIYTYGTLFFTAAALVTGLSTSTPMFLGGRVLQGVGSAMIFGTGVAILTSAFPPRERGRVLGINVAAVYLGLSLGPSIGGLLTAQLGWRSIFLVSVALGAIVLVFVWRRLRGEWAEARGESFDLPGTLIYATSLVALMLGISRLPGLAATVLITAGVVGLGFFAAWEMRIRVPVLDIRLLRSNRPFAFSNLAALINYAATAATAFLLSLYLRYIKGLDAQTAGVVLIAQPVIQAVFSPLAGRLSDRVEPRIVASAGMALTALGLVLLVVISPTTPLWAIVLRLGLMGFGFALFSSPNMNAIMGAVEKRLYGVASAMLATMRLMGQMLSQGIATLLFALYIGRVEISPQNYPQFMAATQTAFAIFAVLCGLGVLASMARGKIR
jgi:EmrB/QacA subfamily drug resistance transporter